MIGADLAELTIWCFVRARFESLVLAFQLPEGCVAFNFSPAGLDQIVE